MNPSTQAPLRLWLHGASGRMGQEIQQAVQKQPSRYMFVGGSSKTFEGETFYQGRLVTPPLLGERLAKDQPDIILDFSSVEGHRVLLKAMELSPRAGTKVLIGTTGLTTEIREEWRSLAATGGLSVLMAPNTSVGILMLAKVAIELLSPLKALGFDIELIETHHRMKVDAPSGTAQFLAQCLRGDQGPETVVFQRQGPRQAGEIGVHAVRGGGVFGEHEIRILGDQEAISIKHTAFSRALFASGALILADWLKGKVGGFYELADVDLSQYLRPA